VDDESNAGGVNWDGFFWIGLIGILGTGVMVGMGGANYWALANIGNLGRVPSAKGLVLMLVLAILVALFDLCAFGVVFAGGVIVIQRLRGRM
jgi:hypothetical protein